MGTGRFFNFIQETEMSYSGERDNLAGTGAGADGH